MDRPFIRPPGIATPATIARAKPGSNDRPPEGVDPWSRPPGPNEPTCGKAADAGPSHVNYTCVGVGFVKRSGESLAHRHDRPGPNEDVRVVAGGAVRSAFLWDSLTCCRGVSARDQTGQFSPCWRWEQGGPLMRTLPSIALALLAFTPCLGATVEEIAEESMPSVVKDRHIRRHWRGTCRRQRVLHLPARDHHERARGLTRPNLPRSSAMRPITDRVVIILKADTDLDLAILRVDAKDQSLCESTPRHNPSRGSQS